MLPKSRIVIGLWHLPVVVILAIPGRLLRRRKYYLNCYIILAARKDVTWAGSLKKVAMMSAKTMWHFF